ncbi:MAG: hypothetical protein IT282_16740 [Bacteroidetes bacterium]|nr:hypothetical protein [Bacteroidota bacterium]
MPNRGQATTVYQRAAQLWAVLAYAATNRQIITYPILSKLAGIPNPALGKMLEPIQTFCEKKKIPPLTVLVVKEKSGMPGTGFIAAADIPEARMRVFGSDWLKYGAPSPDNIKTTCGVLKQAVQSWGNARKRTIHLA